MNLWFTEDLSIVPGTRAQILIKKTLHSEHTPFQRIDVFESETCGRMLALDGVIQTTEFDESSYHEMIAHVPLFSHPCPKKILIIGGGDGGTVREALKHPTVEEIHLCEIDQRVVEVCEDFIPSIAGFMRNSRVHLHFEDGAKWAKDHPETYDIIIVDSSDPIGPAEILFKYPFYESCRRALKDGGIMTAQAENFFLHTPIIRSLLESGKKLFPIYKYYYTTVPTYPGGLIGFTFFSTGPQPQIVPATENGVYADFIKKLNYWTPEIQSKSFVLPARANRELYESL